MFGAPTPPPPKRVTETCEAFFSNADLLQSFRNVRVNFARFALESMMPESCAAGINVMCGDNDLDLPQIIELRRQAWPFEGRWCEMWRQRANSRATATSERMASTSWRAWSARR